MDCAPRMSAFNPDPHALFTVKAGTTVTWINDDDIPHTVASSSKLFKSKTLDTEGKFLFTFTTPGSYEYFCSLNLALKSMNAVRTKLREAVLYIERNPELVKSITTFPYIAKSI